jgi:uncharacterized protein YbjT (DUF2867 family)
MKKILVLGGTGFLGRHVCEQLNRQGWRATVPTRRMINARTVQTLPMVDVIEADVHDPATLARLVPGHDAVVNLVAILHGQRKAFERVHVALPRQLCHAMAQAGVSRLVHVSALGAHPDGPSRYQASKGEGEAVVRGAGLDCTVLRPSVIFGAEDRFLNLFARLQQVAPIVPLAGAQTRFQPVWVGDVAQAVVQCLQRPDTVGQVYECTGPEVFTLADLVRLAGRLSGKPRPIIGLPAALGYFQALALECLPGEPLMSTDNLCSMEVDNVASGQQPGLAELGITAQALEPVAATYLASSGAADPLLQLRQQASRR